MTHYVLLGAGNGSPTAIFDRDPFLAVLQEKTWFNFAGRATIDSLLHKQLDRGYEQYFVFYRDSNVACQVLGTTPFWSQYEVHNADTVESSLSARLRKSAARARGAIGDAEDYLVSRIAGPVPTTGFEYLALWECLGLQRSFTRQGAADLAAIMEKNIFAFGITSCDPLPPSVRSGYAFPIHFHIGDGFEPPSPLDLEASSNEPLYVGAYSRELNKTRIYGCYKGEQVQIANGDIANDPALRGKSATLLDRPVVELARRSAMPELQVRSVRPLARVEVFAVDESATFTHVGTLNRETSDQGAWQNYRASSDGFTVQVATGQRWSQLVAYALDHNGLAGMATLDAASV